MWASAFFSIHKKNGPVSYARRDDFISPLVIRSQPPLAEEPEKSTLGHNKWINATVSPFASYWGDNGREWNALMEMVWWPGQCMQGAASNCSFGSPLLPSCLFRSSYVTVCRKKYAMKMLTFVWFLWDMEMQEAVYIGPLVRIGTLILCSPLHSIL